MIKKRFVKGMHMELVLSTRVGFIVFIKKTKSRLVQKRRRGFSFFFELKENNFSFIFFSRTFCVWFKFFFFLNLSWIFFLSSIDFIGLQYILQKSVVVLSCTFSGLWSHWSRLCMYFSAYITHCRAVIIIFLIFLSYFFLRLYKHEKKKVGDAITCAFWCWLMLTRNLLIGQFNIVVKETTDRVLIASTFGKCSAVKRRKVKRKICLLSVDVV